MRFSTVLLAGLLSTVIQAQTIVFVRHGETLANATGRYNGRTINTFSPRGAKEVAELAPKLRGRRYDFIVVSPSERALKTIAPFLREQHRKAVIWPELYECCDAHTKRIKGLTSGSVRYGAKIKIPKGLESLFVLEPDHDRYILAPSYDDGLRQIRLTAGRIQHEFRPNQTVLVVGHSLHGGRLLEQLQGRPVLGKIRPENAQPMVYAKNAAGLFSPTR